MMSVLKTKQVEFIDAPDCIKVKLLHNQAVMICEREPDNVTHWILHTMTKWIDENINCLYSIDVMRNNNRTAYTVYDPMIRAYASDNAVKSPHVIVRFTDEEGLNAFVNQCMIWKLVQVQV